MKALSDQKWHVLPDPIWKDKHPLHQARFIATSTDVEIDGESWEFANPEDSIICTLPDSEHQKAHAELISHAPELLQAVKAGTEEIKRLRELVAVLTKERDDLMAARLKSLGWPN